MIVFRHPRCAVEPRVLLHQLTAGLGSAARRAPGHDDLVPLLIDAGELAAAVADARAPDRDGLDPVATALTSITVRLAAAVDASWREDGCSVRRTLHEALDAARAAEQLPLPRRAERGVAEGFAYYALGPELYADAARRWWRAHRPPHVWCIGLRTIGLTLAASAAAALQAEGADAQVASVRPRGHPFARRVTLDADLAAHLTCFRARSECRWLIVDEGPGLSGSSMAGAAEALSAAGLADGQIVLMPGHRPSLDTLTPEIRRRWHRHTLEPADFDATWVSSRRLHRTWRADELTDISSGRWRTHERFATSWPAVHPQHERRKYRVVTADEARFVKFAGLGRYGRARMERAWQGADAGWMLPSLAFSNGWMHVPWVDAGFGAGALTRDTLQELGGYLAFVARTGHDASGVSTPTLLEMAIDNTRAFCSDDAARALERLWPGADTGEVLTDNRMHPHEWCRHRGRLLKFDGIEHGDDHFFPGACDVAWDVAGAIEEWALDREGQQVLLERFAATSGDRTIARRLPFYRAAYLAFRTAYTAMSRDQLAGTPDGTRFAVEHRRYRQRLSWILAPFLAS